ncbi:hypothetical protein NLJ89_g4390 [Agrocybe chaxingu]|uniref:Terpenoid synthase n=1 Tax=Agrocybe chaxingu TaxID=84603 RepID=A0A9W8K2S7_9AGAR|nr:hypothetical protein NLJ89_g4390 [Agrocybe chaxingu]
MLSLIELPYLPVTRALNFSVNQRYPTRRDRISSNMSKNAGKTDTHYTPTSPDDIRDVLNRFFERCQIRYDEFPYDIDLHNLCIEEAHKHSYPVDPSPGVPSILKALPAGVAIAATSYAHLHSRDVQVFIALYTGFLVYLDDCVTHDVSGVDMFVERFISGHPQDNDVLESLALFLRETYVYYSGIQANIIMTSTLNFITSVVLENKTQTMQPSPDAHGYPTFARYLSGVSEAYAFFAFPPSTPLGDYIQALPEMTMFICCTNDILSFYKEERDHESFNYISIQAGFRGKSKVEILSALADDVVTCLERIMRIVDANEDVKAAFGAFAKGYVYFHTSLQKRYHLDELFSV